MSNYDKYKEQVEKLTLPGDSGDKSWKKIYDWIQDEAGCTLFLQAFRHETSIPVNPDSNADTRIESALAKTWGEDSRKIQTDAHYKSHAEMFVNELNEIVSRVPRENTHPSASSAYGNVIRFVHRVLLDSLALFEHWGSRNAKVPRAFGVVKNEWTHPVNFYHGARQIIYGQGSFGLSFGDNHSEIAVATIRQALEVRLRSAFGLIGKESMGSGAFHPVPISILLEILSEHREEIYMPIPIYNVTRINNWANLLLHSGVREYAWTLPRVLEYLRSWLVGGDKVGGSLTVDSGIRLSRSSFQEIQDDIRARIESVSEPNEAPRFKAVLLEASECSVVFVAEDK